MVAQIPYAAAMDGTFPRIFRRENANESPSVSLWVTSGIMQLTMIFVYFESNAWNTMLSVTSVMILPPYLASTAFLWKLCAKRKYPENMPVSLPFAYVCGAAGSIYCLWMIYAAGLQYLLMAFVFLAIGIPFYIRARQDALENGDETAISAETGEPHAMFTAGEAWSVFVIVAVAVTAILLFATDTVKL